ncbi:5'/3'-nucleotidase SurE [bacterium]|nr:5'/3'-nucleotidase SurE [bacterium]
MRERPSVLVTNDDGIEAPGLHALGEALSEAADVVVVAPTVERSAVSSAITLMDPLRIRKWRSRSGLHGYAVTGTPVDCVKIAVRKLLLRRPDVIMSGINHGENTGVNILYSGTAAAAAEGAVQGIPSVAFSLADPVSGDFSTAAAFSRVLLDRIIDGGLPRGVYLNVNVPACSGNDIRGVAVTSQGNAVFHEEFNERLDPRKGTYYWITGRKAAVHPDIEYDESAVARCYISVTPLQVDYTSYPAIESIAAWQLTL